MFNVLKGIILGDLENAPYQIVRSGQGYEVRQYAGGQWISSKMQAPGKDAVSRELFMRLYYYITGENDTQSKLAMTKPVVTRVDSGDYNNTYTMSLWIPQQWQANPPKPTNPEVFLETWPTRTVAVKSFGGFAKDAINNMEKQALELAVSAENDIITSHHFIVGYDPPFKLVNRLNEIWLEIQTGQGGGNAVQDGNWDGNDY